MDWFQSLFTNTGSVAHIVVLYCLVIAVGVVLGKIKFGSISLGVTFVLFAGIVVGHIYNATGIADPDGGYACPAKVLTFIQDFGLILFVYCIGLQVGPGFFQSFKKGGMQMNLITIGIVTLNVLTMLALYYLVFDTNDKTSLPMAVGVLYGAVTNTPGLGAAQEAINTLGIDMGGQNIANGYACAYPLGVVGIIGATIAIRYILRIKLEKEEEEIRRNQEDNPHAKPHYMSLRVENKSLEGKTILQQLQQQSPANTEVFEYHGCKIKRRSLLAGIQYYDLVIKLFLHHCFESNTCDTEESNGGKWVDMMGMLAPKAEIDSIIKDIANGSITSFCELKEILRQIHKSYRHNEQRYANHVMQTCGDNLFIDRDHWMREAEESHSIWLKMIRDDAEKEYQMGDVEPEQLRSFLEKIK